MSTASIFPFLLAFSVFLKTGECGDSLRFNDCSTSTCLIEEDELSLIVVGDTGGIPLLETTLAQKSVAKAIAAHSKGSAAVINLGDNFYFTGVISSNDTRFKTRFEDVYKETKLPWFFIAGNHDHFGDVQAQIDYSARSEKWLECAGISRGLTHYKQFFPGFFYKLSWASTSFSVDFMMLDTMILCGKTADVKSGKFSDLVLAGFDHPPAGAEDPIRAEREWAWLEENLYKSRADYLFVAGHYPVHSTSSHGPTKCLLERLDPLMRRHNVTAYLAGHDHSLQHIRYDNMDYIVSGAASRVDHSKKNEATLPKGALRFRYPRWSLRNMLGQLGFSDGGFVKMQLSSDSATVIYYDRDNQKRYQTALYPRHAKDSLLSIKESSIEL